jgi:hypothetical protein
VAAGDALGKYVVTLLSVAIGQDKPKLTKETLQGAWTFTSVTLERADGTKVEPWGPKPNGSAIFTPDGRYMIVVSRADLPKFASKDRMKGTPEENQAIVQGVLAHFGRYSVNEADGTFTMHVEGSSFPNDVGTDQKRIATSLTSDELTFTNPSPTTGSKASVTWRRAK